MERSLNVTSYYNTDNVPSINRLIPRVTVPYSFSWRYDDKKSIGRLKRSFSTKDLIRDG